MEKVRPYLILGETHRMLVAEKIRKQLREWLDLWLARGSVAPSIVQLDQCSGSDWIVAESGPMRAVGIGYTRQWLDQAARLFAGPHLGETGTHAEEDIASHICRSALESLAMRLCGSDGRLVKPQQGPREAMAAPGSGYLGFECRFDEGLRLEIVAWPEWVALHRVGRTANRSDGTPLVSPVRALDNESVRIEAIVGEAELPLGDFAELAIGDVLVLERRLDHPLSVRIDGGDAFAGGHLCAASGKKAVELLSLGT